MLSTEPQENGYCKTERKTHSGWKKTKMSELFGADACGYKMPRKFEEGSEEI